MNGYIGIDAKDDPMNMRKVAKAEENNANWAPPLQ
jgi:hypothetical protein